MDIRKMVAKVGLFTTLFNNDDPAIQEMQQSWGDLASNLGQRFGSTLGKALYDQLVTLQAVGEEDWLNGLIIGLANHRLDFQEAFNLACLHMPDHFLPLRPKLQEIVWEWANDRLVSERVDEIEASVQYLLEAAEIMPPLTAIAVNRAMSLPPNHPLQDKKELAHLLEEQLKVQLAAGAGIEISEEARQGHRSLALSMIACLVSHKLADSQRQEALLSLGESLLAQMEDDTEHYRRAIFYYFEEQSREAEQVGLPDLAVEYRQKGSHLWKPELYGDEDWRSALQRFYFADRENRPVEARYALQDVINHPADSLAARSSKILASRLLGKRLFDDAKYARSISLLETSRQHLEREYLGAILEQDVEQAGHSLADAVAYLSGALAREEAWEDAVAVLDRSKSLRLRYQAQLRQGPLGSFLRDLERDIYALSRGLKLETTDGDSAQDLPPELTQLLETYRQSREKTGCETLTAPTVAEAASYLTAHEAIVTLDKVQQGFLVTIICSSDNESPSFAELLPRQAIVEIEQLLVDQNYGWLYALSDSELVDRREALNFMLHGINQLLGHYLAEKLATFPVNSLIIVPHLLLHQVPFWALPALAEYHVMNASSLAQFVLTRSEERQLEPRAIVVGNPTGDMVIAELEANRVRHHWQVVGGEVDSINGREATETRVRQALAPGALLHFSGHSRAHVTDPLRSALELQPDWAALGDDDTPLPWLLPRLSRKAKWRDSYQYAANEWIHLSNERLGSFDRPGQLHERTLMSKNIVELTLDYETTGSLLGQYEIDVDGEPGEARRLSELWSVGDILTEGCFAGVGIVFLSSCSAGLGRLNPTRDETISLPAALQLAGAGAIISPLWPVRVEMAALFSDRFYERLIQQGPQLNLLALVTETRHWLRHLETSEAILRLKNIAEGQSARGRLMIQASCHRLEADDVSFPFAHPADWAAFQLTGCTHISTPFVGGAVTTATATERFELPPLPVDVALDGETGRILSQNPTGREHIFEAAAAAETLAAALSGEAADQLNPVLANYLFQQAVAYQLQGDQEAQKESLQKTISLDPSHGEARLLLADLLQEEGALSQALAQLDTALINNPDSIGIRYKRADMLARLNRNEEALVSLDGLLTEQLSETMAFLCRKLRGRLRLLEGAYEVGLADLVAVVTVRPEDHEAHYMSAMAYVQLADLAAAQEAINQALFLQADNGTYLNWRGVVRAETNDLAGAKADFEAAARLLPELGVVHTNLAKVISQLGDSAGAIEHYSRAIALGETDPANWANRGYELMCTGRYAQALEDHEHALSIDPYYYIARYNRACTYSLMGQPGSIVADITAAIMADPTVRQHARDDDDLIWARENLPALKDLLSQ